MPLKTPRSAWDKTTRKRDDLGRGRWVKLTQAGPIKPYRLEASAESIAIEQMHAFSRGIGGLSRLADGANARGSHGDATGWETGCPKSWAFPARQVLVGKGLR